MYDMIKIIHDFTILSCPQPTNFASKTLWRKQ